MPFAICNEIFQGWTPDDTFAAAARFGYDAVEIAPFTLAKFVTDISAPQRQALRDAAARHRLAISGIHWVLAQTEGYHLTHPDTAVRTRTARYFRELVDFCADLGGRFIVLGSPKQRSLADGISREQGCEWAAATLHDAIRQAEDRHVTICLEPLSPAETNFLNTAAEVVQFVETFGSHALRMILDVKAMCSESKPIPKIIHDSWPCFAYFHANDRNLKGPGFGDVDFVPIAAALRDVGYTGYVSVEVFNFDEGPELIARRSLEYLQRTVAYVPEHTRWK